MLSKEALQVVQNVFGPRSKMNLPVSWSEFVVEINMWVLKELAKKEQELKESKENKETPPIPSA